LAVRELRRDLEHVTPRGGAARRAVVAVARTELVRELNELIAALDRRVPRVQRAGEASIARDAAMLRAKALKRLEELANGSEW
jgi:hypothetical protein